MTESISHAGDQDQGRGPTVLSVEDISGVQYPLGLSDRFTTSTPFQDDPTARYEFSAGAADQIALMPALDGAQPEGASHVWKRHTEGPDHVPSSGPFRIPLVPERFQAKAQEIWESPRARRVIYMASAATVVAASVVGGVMGVEKAFGQGHDGPQGNSGHGNDNGDAPTPTGDIYTDYRSHANPQGDGINSHVGPQAWATAAAAQNIAEQQHQQLQLDLPLDGIDQDSEPVDPRPYKVYAPFTAKNVSMDELPDAPTALPPTVVPPKSADLGFEYGEGSVRAALAANAYPGDKVVVDFQRAVNDGPDTAENTSALITLDAGVDYDAESPASVNCEPVAADPVPADKPEQISCVVDDGSMNPDETTALPIDIGVIVNLDTPPGDIGAQAQLRADEIDPNPANNFAHATINVDEPPVVEPLVQVNGPAFERPDSRADWKLRSGIFDYLGSLSALADGKRIDAFRVVDSEGIVRCEFTSDGLIVVGDPKAIEDPTCTTQLVSRTTFPVANNKDIPYIERGAVDRPVYYAPPETNYMYAPGPFELSAQADVLSKDDAGILILRRNTLSPIRGTFVSSERFGVLNRDGEYVFVQGTGKLVGAVTRPEDINQDIYLHGATETVLGRAIGPIHLSIESGDLENDFCNVELEKDGELVRVGRFNLGKIEEGESPYVRAMLRIPVGADFGDATFDISRPPDRQLGYRAITDQDQRTVDRFVDPKTGKPWLTFQISYTDGQSSGQIMFPDEMRTLVKNHAAGGLVIENNRDTTIAEFMGTLPQLASEQAEYAMSNGIPVISALEPFLDNDDYVAVIGTKTKISPLDIKPEAAMRVLDEKIRVELALMDAVRKAGGIPQFVISGFDGISFIDNPYLHLQKSGGSWRVGGIKPRTDTTPGSYDKLLTYISDRASVIASSEFPELDMSEIDTGVTLPIMSGQTFIDHGDIVNSEGVADFLADHPEINYPIFIDNAFGVGRFGKLVELGVPAESGGITTEQLKGYLLEVVNKIKVVRPDIKRIGLANISGIPSNAEPNVEQGYHEHFINAAREVYEETGMHFVIRIPQSPGGNVNQNTLFDGPYPASPGGPWGIQKDMSAERVISRGTL